MLSIVETFVIQLAIIGVAILLDRRENPVFPRWVGYVNLWMSVLFVPGNFLVFFKTGPMAWDGVFIFWIPFVAFLTWFSSNTWAALRAVE